MTKSDSHRWRALVENLNESFITLKENEHHFIANVLRLKTGSQLELCDGLGSWAIAQLKSVQKNSSIVEILQKHFSPKPTYEKRLIVGLPKQPAIEESVVYASEIGISELIFVRTDKCQNKGNVDIRKYQRRALEALRISKNPYQTKVSLSDSFTNVLDTLSHNHDLFLADERPLLSHQSEPVLFENSSFQKGTSSKGCVIIIGPEASFSDDEYRQLQTRAFPKILLGKSILRVPMAVAYASVLLSELHK